MILTAEGEPFSIMKIKKPSYTATLNTEVWESHFCKILNHNNNEDAALLSNENWYICQPSMKVHILYVNSNGKA
jgi:hypothetical protein